MQQQRGSSHWHLNPSAQEFHPNLPLHSNAATRNWNAFPFSNSLAHPVNIPNQAWQQYYNNYRYQHQNNYQNHNEGVSQFGTESVLTNNFNIGVGESSRNLNTQNIGSFYSPHNQQANHFAAATTAPVRIGEFGNLNLPPVPMHAANTHAACMNNNLTPAHNAELVHAMERINVNNGQVSTQFSNSQFCSNVETNNKLTSPQTEEEVDTDIFNDPSKINIPLRMVIVHFVGADPKASDYPKDLTIQCKNGIVKANRELMIMCSGEFFDMAKGDVMLLGSFCCHIIYLVVELVTIGRVVLLSVRLNSFMKALRLLRIPGVFESGANRENDSTVESTLEVPDQCPSVINSYSYKGCAADVFCSICRVTFIREMFHKHYAEYHSVVDAVRCCGLVFVTKYDLVRHRHRMCSRELRAALSVSAIGPPEDEISNVCDNLDVDGPGSNAHSTPIH